MQTPPVTSFTAFDWFLIVVVVASTLAAFSKGFIRVLLSVLGVLVGLLVASWYYLAVATTLHQWIVSFPMAEVLAFLIIFVLVVILFACIAKLLRKAVSAVGLGFIDRLLGGAIGFIRGLLLGVAAMMAAAAFIPNLPPVRDSQLAPYFLDGVHAVSFVVPEHLQDQLATGARQILQQSPELFRPHTLQ